MKRTAFITLAVLAAACSPSTWEESSSLPPICPDYIGVTVPQNIAPLNFKMADGRHCKISRRTEGDTIFVAVRAWEKGARKGTAYREFPIYVSKDRIDPYICYRLIEPGYESWHDISICQRELGSYDEKIIVDNKANGQGCLNCHTFPQGDPDRMLFHARGKGGGTVFFDKGQARLVNLAQSGPGKQGTYPAWNPDGVHIVFSSNTTHQCFTIRSGQPIEVYDTASDIILMDTSTDSITVHPLLSSEDELETFPAWSEDGRTLYYCSAVNPGDVTAHRGEIHYRLMAMEFDGTGFTGEPRVIFANDSLSVSFPRIHADKLVFTAAAFGTFPIWHKEADLWMLDLEDGSVRPLDEINSDDTESYHSWSSDGRWMIFSSRRGDGRYTRLYITHFDGTGFSKPFLLPQRDADFDMLRLKSYNLPEFVCGEIDPLQKPVSALFR